MQATAQSRSVVQKARALGDLPPSEEIEEEHHPVPDGTRKSSRNVISHVGPSLPVTFGRVQFQQERPTSATQFCRTSSLRGPYRVISLLADASWFSSRRAPPLCPRARTLFRPLRMRMPRATTAAPGKSPSGLQPQSQPPSEIPPAIVLPHPKIRPGRTKTMSKRTAAQSCTGMIANQNLRAAAPVTGTPLAAPMRPAPL